MKRPPSPLYIYIYSSSIRVDESKFWWRQREDLCRFNSTQHQVVGMQYPVHPSSKMRIMVVTKGQKI